MLAWRHWSWSSSVGAQRCAGQEQRRSCSARLRYTATFDDPNLPGEMQTTVTLTQVSVGTEVSIVQEGVPGVIPAEACYLGWQESLTLLAQLVEAEIPD